MSPEICPQCGALLPRHAKACPECGSDEQTGWSHSAHADHLGIQDDHFNYDEFVKEEFGAPSRKPRGIHWIWWVTALLMALLLLFLCLR